MTFTGVTKSDHWGDCDVCMGKLRGKLGDCNSYYNKFYNVML